MSLISECKWMSYSPEVRLDTSRTQMGIGEIITAIMEFIVSTIVDCVI